MSKKLIGLLVVAAVVVGLGVLVASGPAAPRLGGTTNYDAIDVSDGYKVDGTAIIDGSGNWTGSTKTASFASLTTSGSISGLEPVAALTASSTLTTSQSKTTFYIATTGAAYTLPAVASSAGVSYRFVVGSAFSTDAVITSAEGDNIEGALIVAGAVVDCDANDVITFVADGENLGDFVEIRSNGTKWYIGESGGLTASKLTCTG